MENLNVADFEVGATIEGFYLAASKEIRQTKAGKDYISLKIQDSTGTASGKIWDNAAEIGSMFSQGDIIKIQALVGSYNQEIDLNIKRLRKAEKKDNVSIADLLPSTPYDIDEMTVRLNAKLDTVKDPFLSELITAFRNDEEFWGSFLSMPASKTIHHPYVGGLLEHTLSVVEILDALVAHYDDDINRDILITGGFLHDIGKIRELSPEPGGSYTDEGLMLGHMVLGAEMVRSTIAGLSDFPTELEMELLHTVISHQGIPEWGSPVVPMTREALIIHFVDNMDAKQFIAKHALQEASGEDHFTPKVYPLNQSFYRRLPSE